MLTQAAIAFWKYNLANPPPSNRRAVPLHALTLNETFTIPKFCNGLTLHDYQETGVRWMVGKFCNKTNCILGDEVSNCLCAICLVLRIDWFDEHRPRNDTCPREFVPL